jgi:hypothetical protein
MLLEQARKEIDRAGGKASRNGAAKQTTAQKA